jgi:hypothetical protein
VFLREGGGGDGLWAGMCLRCDQLDSRGRESLCPVRIRLPAAQSSLPFSGMRGARARVRGAGRGGEGGGMYVGSACRVAGKERSPKELAVQAGATHRISEVGIHSVPWVAEGGGVVVMGEGGAFRNVQCGVGASPPQSLSRSSPG